MFGKHSSMVSNPSTCSTKASDMENTKHRLHNHQLRSRPQSKMASETKPVLAMPLPSTAAIQLMSRDQPMKQLSGQREDGVEGESKGTETGSSAMDNELMHIPKEYTRLVGMGAEHSKQLQGTMATKARRGQGECSVCTQLYRKADCKEYHSLPFMKTMMKVIENRTSSLLTTHPSTTTSPSWELGVGANGSPIHRPRPRDRDRGKEIPKKLGEEGLQHEEEDIRQKPVVTADLNNIFN